MAARKPKKKKVSLIRTTNFDGTYYPPGEILELDSEMADELIDLEAAEPVLVVAQVEEEPDGTDDE